MNSVYCINEENRTLLKYEVKAPDYELISDRPIPVYEKNYTPKRYNKIGDKWISKQATGNHACLMFTGDLTCFSKQFEQARTERGYDFHYAFDEVRPLFAQSDLVVGNLETMVFPAAPYRTEKLVSEQNYYCNAPLEFLEAIREAGFDVVTTANNHDLDTGALGIGETIDNIERFGLIQTGTFKTGKRRFELIQVRGFTIAIVAFATEHNHKQCNLTRAGAQFLLQTYHPDLAAAIARDARSAGAELVFAYVHWGVEHKLVQNSKQKTIASSLAEAGYDCIIGSHPHVLQPFSHVEHSGKKIPVFYSLGNFISHNALNNKARSAVACIDLSRQGKEINLQCSYIPVYTAWEYCGEKYTVLPIFHNASEPRNIRIRTRIAKIIGAELVPNTEHQLVERVENTPAPGNRESRQKPNLSEVEDFPVPYTHGKFTYHLYKDHACLVHTSDDISSASVPETILNLPVTEAAESAFSGNSALTKLNMNSRFTVISKGMFKNCAALEGLRIGPNVCEIGDSAFANCASLTAIVTRDKVAKIGNRAFSNCPNLVTVKITPGVIEIAEDAFEGSSHIRIYCERDSYAEQYAKRLNIPCTVMEFYEDSYMQPTSEHKQIYQSAESSVEIRATASRKAFVAKMIEQANRAEAELLTEEDFSARNQARKYSGLVRAHQPDPIIAACYYLGTPLPSNASGSFQPSVYLPKIPCTLVSLRERLGAEMIPDTEEVRNEFSSFKKKFESMVALDFNDTDLAVFYTDYLMHCKDFGYRNTDYFDFDFYKSDLALRRTFISTKQYKRYVRRVCIKDIHLFKDKGNFNQKFAAVVHRDWVDTTQCTLEEFQAFVQRNPTFFAKPIRGTGGVGACVVRSDKYSSMEKLFQFCRQQGYIAEERVRQHPALAAFNPDTLNTIRVYALVDKDDKVHIPGVFARFGRVGKAVDNFHSGGMGAAVNVDTGVLMTDAYDIHGTANELHPDSGLRFKGFQLPEWEKILKTVETACIICKDINRHIGWDIAIREDGQVEIIEGNATPNFDFLQTVDKVGKYEIYNQVLTPMAIAAGITPIHTRSPVLDVTNMLGPPIRFKNV